MGQCWAVAPAAPGCGGNHLGVLWGPLQKGGMGVAEPPRELPVTPAWQPMGMGPCVPGWVPLTKPVPSSFQCHPALDGQRGKCWCVDRKTGVKLPGFLELKGDLDCHQLADSM